MLPPVNRVQSRCSAQLTSNSSPTNSFLRAKSCRKLTILFCRLPLPTLFYRPEAVHLGDLLRIWVRLSTKIILSPSDFQGPTKALWTLQEPQCFTVAASLSPGKLISGSRTPYKEKTTLPRAIADVSEFVCVTALVPEGTISLSEFGNINPIPFRIIFTVSLTLCGCL